MLPNIVIYGNSLGDCLTALIVTAVTLLVLWLLRTFLVRRLAHLIQESPERVASLIGRLTTRTHILLLLIISLYFGSLALDLMPTTRRWLSSVAVVAFIIQMGIWLDALIIFWLQRYRVQRLVEDPDEAGTIQTLSIFIRVGAAILVVAIALDNIPGIEVKSLVTGLGITGVAVALAVQNILGDLFASLSIALDKPFVNGDFISVGDFTGSVENVGLKTTRVRSLSGEEIIFPNSDLLGSRVRNFKAMPRRRVVFALQVTYDTSADQLEAIPGMVQRIVEAQPSTQFDRAHLKAFGDFSLNFEVVYFMTDSSYVLYMDTQQQINLEIYRLFEREGIEFAYPTQKVFVEREAG